MEDSITITVKNVPNLERLLMDVAKITKIHYREPIEISNSVEIDFDFINPEMMIEFFARVYRLNAMTQIAKIKKGN